MSDNSQRRIMICAPSSGSGKTLITCALLRILQRHGYNPASFKCGPDYIDPMFHRTVLGIPSRNLDMFFAGMNRGDGVSGSLSKGMQGRDFGVIEGVMGFFDGNAAGSTEGSSYEVSCITDTPAILVVNARGMSTSVVPLVKGFCDYDAEKRIQGIILNNISPSVSESVARLIYKETGVHVIGTLPVLKDIELKSRHLGLVMPEEIPDILEKIDKAADELDKNLDFDRFLEIADRAGKISLKDSVKVEQKPVTRIGVARDEAFCFYYQDNFELMEELGAELVFFSPIHDKTIPEVDRLIFGGGYPELYAKELSQNSSMLQSIRAAADSGMPILAECGGYLYLLETLLDPEKEEYKMAGVFSGTAYMTDKLSHFGYVKVTRNSENIYLLESEEIRGHEFHYYKTTREGDVFKMTKPTGDRSWCGYRARNKVLAGFAHLYYPSCRSFIKRFIDA